MLETGGNNEVSFDSHPEGIMIGRDFKQREIKYENMWAEYFFNKIDSCALTINDTIKFYKLIDPKMKGVQIEYVKGNFIWGRILIGRFGLFPNENGEDYSRIDLCFILESKIKNLFIN